MCITSPFKNDSGSTTSSSLPVQKMLDQWAIFQRLRQIEMFRALSMQK